MHATLQKFNAKNLGCHQNQFWTICVRISQPVWGSFVVICNDDVRGFDEISNEAFIALGSAFANLERMMKGEFGAVRLNLSCLMMVDPHVHFHVISRFDKSIDYNGNKYVDVYYPGLAPLDGECCVGGEGLEDLRNFFAERLNKVWKD